MWYPSCQCRLGTLDEGNQENGCFKTTRHQYYEYDSKGTCDVSTPRMKTETNRPGFTVGPHWYTDSTGNCFADIMHVIDRQYTYIYNSLYHYTGDRLCVLYLRNNCL